jgi:hypothetical protein
VRHTSSITPHLPHTPHKSNVRPLPRTPSQPNIAQLEPVLCVYVRPCVTHSKHYAPSPPHTPHASKPAEHTGATLITPTRYAEFCVQTRNLSLNNKDTTRATPTHTHRRVLLRDELAHRRVEIRVVVRVKSDLHTAIVDNTRIAHAFSSPARACIAQSCTRTSRQSLA